MINEYILLLCATFFFTYTSNKIILLWSLRKQYIIKCFMSLNTNLIYDHNWINIDNASQAIENTRKKAYSHIKSQLLYDLCDIENNADVRYLLITRLPIRIQTQEKDFLNKGYKIKKITGNYIQTHKNKKMIDVSGSYGVNIIGNDYYKKLNRTTMPINLGIYTHLHKKLDKKLIKLVDLNVNKNKIFFSQSKYKYEQFEVCTSYYNSGTEAVEASIRLCQYNTSKKLFVTFDNAYHGWTSKLINGFVKEPSSNENLVLPFNLTTLQVIKNEHKNIAAILFNPIAIYNIRQNDIFLDVDLFNISSKKNEEFIKNLETLQEICFMYNIAFIIDEVYSAFRFSNDLLYKSLSVKLYPDIVIMGKTLACGFSNGVAVGFKHYLQRVNNDEMYNRSVVQGTFAGNINFVKGALTFLNFIHDITYNQIFNMLDHAINDINNKSENIKLKRYGLLVTVDYLKKSPYNWLLQLYMLNNGIYLSCYGTSRMNFNTSFTVEEIYDFKTKVIKSIHDFERDEWLVGRERNLISTIYFTKCIVNTFIYKCIIKPYNYIMLAKRIDVDVSHNNKLNFITHFTSSLVTTGTYYTIFFTPYFYTSVYTFLLCQIIRQAGHFLFEKSNDQAEEAKIGFRNKSKRLTFVIFSINLLVLNIFNLNFNELIFNNLCVVMVLKIGTSCAYNGVGNTFLWIIKIITDMFTDLYDFAPSTWIDVLRDKSVLQKELNQNFIPKFVNEKKSIVMAYFMKS